MGALLIGCLVVVWLCGAVLMLMYVEEERPCPAEMALLVLFWPLAVLVLVAAVVVVALTRSR